jgi:hypothetical protein|tara:strand:+ start:55 stop:357 length:303 start_codon:yes stop_codon:yes gene_type:complete
MDDEEVTQAFNEWLLSEGDEIAEEIYNQLKLRSGKFEIEDGSHASWVEDSLGILIVLPFEHAMAFGHEAQTEQLGDMPMHSYVFAAISELIMRACSLMDD